MTSVILMIKFTAKRADGKTVRFNVREPNSPSASRYAFDRAVKIAARLGYTELKFA